MIRVLERRYRRSRKNADKSAWLSEMKSLHALYEEKNRQYWRNDIADSKGDSRRLWRTMSGIMGEKQTSSDSGGFTTDEFASFFVDTVETIHQSTSSTPLHQSEQYTIEELQTMLNIPLLAKLREKVVQGQLQHYLTANNAMPQHQSTVQYPNLMPVPQT